MTFIAHHATCSHCGISSREVVLFDMGLGEITCEACEICNEPEPGPVEPVYCVSCDDLHDRADECRPLYDPKFDVPGI